METRETITLDARAQQRLMVLSHVLAGELDEEQASRPAGFRHMLVWQALRANTNGGPIAGLTMWQ